MTLKTCNSSDNGDDGDGDDGGDGDGDDDGDGNLSYINVRVA